MEELYLYNGLKTGNPEALEDIINKYGSCVFKLVSRIMAGTGTRADIEECCSDTFLAVWHKRKQYNPQKSFLRTWVLVLARYTALDYRRKLSGRDEKWDKNHCVEEKPGGGKTPEEVFLDREKRDAVMTALKALPEHERELLYRYYFLEENAGIIAKELNISRSAVDTRLWRARKTLRKYFDENGKAVTSGE